MEIKMKDHTRVKELKNYLKRLNNGEALEEVRADFVDNFKNVEAMEIMEAEQEMIEEGIPIEEVQKLCDIHSALFHGDTRDERIANAEKEVANSIKRNQEKQSIDKNEKAQELIAIDGHPLNILHRENDELEKLLKKAKKDLNSSQELSKDLVNLLPVIDHYAKKGDIIYPHLNVQYGVSGPSNVMWTVDDEIRDELKKLVKETEQNDEWKKRTEDVLQRMQEMIFKEENILFPAAALMFTEDEWNQVSRDLLDFPECFGITQPETIEEKPSENIQINEDEIILPGGSLKNEELRAIMKSVPLEITFIDKNDINKYFNEGPKVFKRPLLSLGHDVFSCHPPKVEKMVHKIIEDFKSGDRDQVQIWMEKNEKPYLVTYMAVRDDNNNFLGTMETVQEMAEIEKHFEKKLQKSLSQ